MPEDDVLERMREEWNGRAREDANYYVAFGRKEQGDEEFFASASDVVRSLEGELKRLPGRDRALEIGCGPGRVMRPLSRHFTEIHGVDVSDEMIRLAMEKLRGVANAHVHRTSGADLSVFRDDFFDFVYSYAVFQHIPSREVVFEYLAEARRVLKPGGILRCQINGLPETAARYSTWNGVRISAEDVAQFARDHDFQLFALEGVCTQYMWTTWRKQPAGWGASLERRKPQAAGTAARIRNVCNAHTGEPLAPSSGVMAAVSLWIEHLPPDCDLNHLAVTVDGRACRLLYLGPSQWAELSQLNAALPPSIRTGLAPVEVTWPGEPLCPPAWIRIIPTGPAVPRVCSVTDGVNLLSRKQITSGSVKTILEEITAPVLFRAAVDVAPVRSIDFFCTDPVARRFEFNLRLPAAIQPGPHELRMGLGKRDFAPVPIEVCDS